MSNTLTIAGKEFRAYFKTPVAFVFLFVFLALTGWFTLVYPDYFTQGEASLRRFFDILPWVFLFLAPAASMKMWAEERKLGTIETLLTMPMRESEIVLGKFLATTGLIALALALTFPLPIIIAYTAAGKVDFGPIAGGYLGALLLGASYVAISLFVSALTRNQIIAFVIGSVCCFILVVIGMVEADVLPKGMVALFSRLSLQTHFQSIGRGVVDTRDILYYASLLTIFLMLNVAALRRR